MVVIEHHPQVMASADWLVELGPAEVQRADESSRRERLAKWRRNGRQRVACSRSGSRWGCPRTVLRRQAGALRAPLSPLPVLTSSLVPSQRDSATTSSSSLRGNSWGRLRRPDSLQAIDHTVNSGPPLLLRQVHRLVHLVAIVAQRLARFHALSLVTGRLGLSQRSRRIAPHRAAEVTRPIGGARQAPFNHARYRMDTSTSTLSPRVQARADTAPERGSDRSNAGAR